MPKAFKPVILSSLTAMSLVCLSFSTSSQGSILDVVTSGQIAWDELQRRAAEPFATLGDKCLVFGNGDEDEEVLRSTPHHTVMESHIFHVLLEMPLQHISAILGDVAKSHVLGSASFQEAPPIPSALL